MVRIELPTPPDPDYGDLHEAMRLKGYARVIQGESGRWWHLPHAVYTKRTRLQPKQLRDQAIRLARNTHPDPRVLVEVTNGSAWSGLRPVTTSDPDPDEGK